MRKCCPIATKGMALPLPQAVRDRHLPHVYPVLEGHSTNVKLDERRHCTPCGNTLVSFSTLIVPIEEVSNAAKPEFPSDSELKLD